MHVCNGPQEKLVLMTPEELAYIMVYICDFFLVGKSFASPPNDVYVTKVDEINEETGTDSQAHAEFAKSNLVVPIKKAAESKKKATILE